MNTTTTRSYDKRLYPTGLNSSFSCSDQSFDCYIKKMQEIIAQTRVDLTPENRHKIIAANSPQQYLPRHGQARYGILLVHGLFDSPHMMSSLFEHYQNQDIPVKSLLLPGHGTVPGDLLEVKYPDWLTAVQYGINSILAEADQVFIIGFSMGGLLSLLASYEYSNIAGICLIAPAIELRHPLANYAHWPIFLNRLSDKFNWQTIKADNDYAKYQSHALNAIKQINKMIEHLENKIDEVSLTTPVFMTFSEQDEVISPTRAESFFAKLSNPRNKCLIYTNQHHSTGGQGQIFFRPSRYPGIRIIDFSHVCIPIAQDHPHYGINGDFEDLRHLDGYLAKLIAKKEGCWSYGAVTLKNIYQHRLKRLTFNPDFPNLINEINHFIADVIK